MPPTRIANLARPYIRRELPAWGKLYRALVGPPDNPRWKNAPARTVRGKLHHHRMQLELSNWSERSAYFLERYYDLDSQLVFRTLIDPGDRVLDVGANIGMMMLLASRLAGPAGRVDCIEPNPRCAARIREHVRINDITNTYLHEVALADENTRMTLRVPAGHTGMGTLAEPTPHQAALITDTVTVPVRRGDELVAQLPGPPRFIKIDVEGFEHRAVRGLAETLRNHRPILLVEFVEHHLARAGTSRRALAAELTDLGLIPYASSVRRARLRYRLALTPLDPDHPATDATDTLWIHPDDPRIQRLAPHLLPPSRAPRR